MLAYIADHDEWLGARHDYTVIHGVFAAPHRAAAFVGQRVVVAEGVSDLVLAQAVSWGADLIVIGTHRRHGVDRFFMGSDAEQILRRAPVPVLLVRCPGEATAATRTAAAKPEAHALTQ